MKKLFPFLLLCTAIPFVVRAGEVEDRFKEFDKNSDGLISGEEMNAAPLLKRLDLDSNGSLTLPEAIQALANLRAKGEAAKEKPPTANEGLFQKLDKNSDGKLTTDELPNKEWFVKLDADKSGDITLEEARAGIARARRNDQLPTGTVVKPASENPDFKESPQILKGSEHGVGHLVADLMLKDSNAAAQKLSVRLQGSRGLVIAFFGATCPISQKFGPELARLEKDSAEQGMRLVLVCPVASETAGDMQKYTAAHGLKSPVIHDQDGSLTKTLAATTTTEVFLIDPARTLVYRGAINDQYGLGYAKEKPKKSYLRDAMAALLRQETPLIAATTAPGCALDHAAKVAAATANAEPVTYHHQISRILQNNCVECHRKGAVGPFSLETYEDVIENAAMMRKQVTRGVMPPWFAEPLVGLDHSPWINDRALAPQDKADLIAWLASDRPKGNPSDAPRPLKFPEEWTIGKPDTVVQLPQPVSIKAEGTMPYQTVTVETNFTEDRWVQAYEIIPTDRKVVHHVIVQVHPKGEKVSHRDEGSSGYWAAYVPGNASHIYPDSFAKKLPAGATVSFQIHYTPNGKATQDQLKMGLVFAKAPPRYIVHTAAVANAKISIPPGEANHVEIGERVLPGDMNLTAYMAHMHVRGKAFKFEATLPGGKTETLLDLPRYDFNWQLRYDYAQPRFLPRGTKVKITAVYDNSEKNPANPDATKTVKWGPQTSDEMMIGYFEYYTPVAGDVAMD